MSQLCPCKACENERWELDQPIVDKTEDRHTHIDFVCTLDDKQVLSDYKKIVEKFNAKKKDVNIYLVRNCPCIVCTKSKLRNIDFDVDREVHRNNLKLYNPPHDFSISDYEVGMFMKVWEHKFKVIEKGEDIKRWNERSKEKNKHSWASDSDEEDMPENPQKIEQKPEEKPVQKHTEIVKRLNEEIASLKTREVIKMILGYKDMVTMYFFGGVVRSCVVGEKPGDHDVVIVSTSRVRAQIFQMINKKFGGDLKTTRGYGGSMTATNHVLVKFRELDLVFVERLGDMKFDFDVNAYRVQIVDHPIEIHNIRDRFNHMITDDQIQQILEKRMKPVNDIDIVMPVNQDVEFRMHRICKMYGKGFIIDKEEAFENFIKMSREYFKLSKDRVITDDVMEKRKLIDEMFPTVFESMKSKFLDSCKNPKF